MHAHVLVRVGGGDTEGLLTQHKHQSDDINQDHLASSNNPKSHEAGKKGRSPALSSSVTSVSLSPALSCGLFLTLLSFYAENRNKLPPTCWSEQKPLETVLMGSRDPLSRLNAAQRGKCSQSP